MICILHGYLLDGSGSNLWTRAIVRALCRDGHVVHLVCQESHPDRYDFITAAYVYEDDGAVTTVFERDTPYAGGCVMHKLECGCELGVEDVEWDPEAIRFEMTMDFCAKHNWMNVFVGLDWVRFDLTHTKESDGVGNAAKIA